MKRTCDESEALDAGEVGVLDGHDSSLSEQLLWVVIDQLPVARTETWSIYTPGSHVSGLEIQTSVILLGPTLAAGP